MVYQKPKEEGTCSVPFLKYVLFLYNFVFLFLSAGAVIGFGVFTIMTKHEFVHLIESRTYPSIAYLLISSGILVVIVAVIGCSGVLREDRRLLLTYIFLLMVSLMLSMLAALLAFIYSGQAHLDLTMSLNNTMMRDYGLDSDRTASIDQLQRTFHCCGAGKFEDWQYSEWRKSGLAERNLVPDSCCRTETLHCGIRDHPSNVYYDDCAYAYQKNIQEHLVIHRAVGSGFGLIQMAGILLSCGLYVKLREFYYNY
ncbi:unnamed protein product [Notodromas monacha]|uniref:Tetraspanin n=1 Tax=Notodromas monacha TaxID=399045 RepID=A0A7R9BKX2_9CRUS|nr:unnamed protein product [Notodromas monacha]CAG0915890.1 unnamed protein product [Notodromas monacha]